MSLEINHEAMQAAVNGANSLLREHGAAQTSRALIFLASALDKIDRLDLAEMLVECGYALLDKERATRH